MSGLDQTLTVRFSEEELAAVRSFASEHGLKTSEFVRDAVKRAVTAQTLMDPQLHEKLMRCITAAADACSEVLRLAHSNSDFRGEEAAKMLGDTVKKMSVKLSAQRTKLEFLLKFLAAIKPPGRRGR